MCGLSASDPTATVTHGAGERKKAALRESLTAATIRPMIGTIDQYLPSIAAAAARPASAAYASSRVSNERRNHNVVAAHNGISTVFALYLSAWKLKNGTRVSSARPAARFSPSSQRAESTQAIQRPRPATVMARR